MKKHYFFIFTLAITVLLAGPVVAQEKENPCAMGKATAPGCSGCASKQVSMDYEGKKIYFCCSSSMEKFNADSAKYLKAMEAKGMTLDSALKPQETCPVTGEKINPAVFVNVEGVTIFACCAGCLDKIKADPAEYVKILQEKGETPVLCLSEGCMSGKPCCPKTGTPPCARTAGKEVKPKT